MKVVIVGYGTMGKALHELLNQKEDIQVVAIKGEIISDNLDLDSIEDFDLLIDFSHPNNLNQILDFLIRRKKKGVLCTTGYNKEQHEQIKNASKEIALLYSFNMSLGINVMAKIIKDINLALDYEFDIEIEEKHHNKKLDAPSGTALMFANELCKDHQYNIINRSHEHRIRSKDEIAIHALRGGNVVGEHSVYFFGNDEYIEVKHCGFSKKLYCLGAYKAARFIINKTPGLYSMDDVINSR